MGAINYGGNTLVNIGFNVTEEIAASACWGDWEQEYRPHYQDKVDEWEGEFYKLVLREGYYEGFYLEIQTPDFCYFDDCQEKQDCLKELTALKRWLLNFVDEHMLNYSPGWVTGWNTLQGTKAAIREECAHERKVLQSTPTYRDYQKGKRGLA